MMSPPPSSTPFPYTTLFRSNRSLANGESVANPETVTWSANGQSGTVTFAAGDTSKTFTVATTDNHVWGTHSPDVTATISNPTDGAVLGTRSAERRVGKEGRSRWSPYH